VTQRGSLMAALDKLVLVREAGGFLLGDEPPAWFDRLGAAGPADQPLTIEGLLPFLEAFLPEAEQAWSGEGAGRAESCLWTQVTPSGEELHLQATALRLGASPLLVITRNDALFDEQRQVLQRARELSLAHAALSHEMERKDVLIHCIVHDLAGPLSSILGSLSLLDERPPGAEGAPGSELVRVAMLAALRQRELLREILDTFAAERTAIDVAIDDFVIAPDLGDAIAQVIEALAPVATSRGARLVGPPPGAASCQVIADDRRLARVLTNLVENAIRYTPRDGCVRVLVTEEPGALRIAVEDEGPGVSPAVAARLFQKFARGRDAAAGTGLGLYFCRITVEHWGGAIGYEARPEGGSRFWVRLRCVPEAASSSIRKGEGGAHGEDPCRRR
jgi:signal transduction histidine kinase